MSDKEINEKLDQIQQDVHMVLQAFPKNEDGSPDVDGHRRAHEEAIEAAKEQKAFWHTLRMDLTRKGITAVIVVAIGLLFLGAMTKLGLPVKPN